MSERHVSFPIMAGFYGKLVADVLSRHYRGYSIYVGAPMFSYIRIV